MKKVSLSLMALLCLCVSMAFSQTPYGNGSDGALTVLSGETVEINSVRTGFSSETPSGYRQISVDSTTGFQTGDEVLIITVKDNNLVPEKNSAGTYEYAYIESISGNTIVLTELLKNSYAEGLGHMVVKVPNYSEVVVSGTLRSPAWDGSTGGILTFRVNGTLTIDSTGIITTSSLGYRGGKQYGSSHGGGQGGESFYGLGGLGGDYTINNATSGAGGGGAAYSGYNGRDGFAGGGGGGTNSVAGKGSVNFGGAGGGAGGHAGSAGGAGYGTSGFGGNGYNNSGNGQNGGDNISGNGGGNNSTGGGGGGGGSYGTADLSRFYFGSGGGCGGRHSGYAPGLGGNGGGILAIFSRNIINYGIIESNGSNGSNGSYYSGAGGGGAGGSLLVVTNTLDLKSSGEILTLGGNSALGHYGNYSGKGGDGRTRISYVNYIDSGAVTPNAYLSKQENIQISQIKNTNDLTGPYTVNAFVYDNENHAITSVRLYYRVNNGSFNQLAMSTSDGGNFTANIPGQPVNSVIDYYIYATDNTDEYYSPVNAPINVHSFEITGFPPVNFNLEDSLNGTVEVNWYHPVDRTNLTGYSVYRSEDPDFTIGSSTLIADNITDTSYSDSDVNDFYTYYYIVTANYDFSGTLNKSQSIKKEILVNNKTKTTIRGYAYLENQSNHKNIKIKFNPTSPAAVLDSTYTNALGYFETTINPGVYNVNYEMPGYQTYYRLENVSIPEDLDLDTSMVKQLGTVISGNVSGTLSGIVSVTGDITIPSGDSLEILPGTEIRFFGKYNVFVYGFLNARGSADQKITFTSAVANQSLERGQWMGIDFYNSSDDNSIIDHAIIKNAVDGIYWDNAKATISNAVIYDCSENGLDLRNDDADVIIKNVEIYNTNSHGVISDHGDAEIDNLYVHNTGSYGIYFHNRAYGTIKNSRFNNNASHGMLFQNWASPRIDSCEVLNNGNWGVRIDYSHPTITNSNISGNSGSGIVYNQDHNDWISPRLNNCIIEDNTGWGVVFRRYIRQDAQCYNNIIRNNGGGIYVWYYSNPHIKGNQIVNNRNIGIHVGDNSWSSPVIEKNIIAYNSGDGIHKNNRGGQTILYNTIYGNNGDGIEINDNNETEVITNNIIVNNTGYGLRNNAAVEQLEYNAFYQNQSGEILNLANAPANTWEFLSLNPNGAPADIYLNINEEPGLSLVDTLDFTLNSNSVCIDAGDVNVEDPDGTRSDVGALYRDSGNPHSVNYVSAGNQSVTISWDSVDVAGLTAYNVYYRPAGTANYQLFGSTQNTQISVTNLTNNVTYDFTVTAIVSGVESGYAPVVSATPGIPQMQLNPEALNFAVNADTVPQTLRITNSGTRELKVVLAEGMDRGYTRMDGSYDCITVGDHAHLSGMDAFTLECWVRSAADERLEPMGKHYTRYQMTLSINEDWFGVYKGYSGGSHYQHFSAKYNFVPNQWYHLAITWTGNTVKQYVNGELIKEHNHAIDDPIADGSYGFDIGRRAGEWSYELNGDIMEARVWNIVRSVEDIKLYKDYSLQGNESGLVGYWPLHKDYNDYSVYGRNGTRSGNTVIRNEDNGLYPKIPYELERRNLTIAPGETDSVTFKFWNTGNSGTFVYEAPINTNVDTNTVMYPISVKYNESIPSTPVHFTPVASTGLPYTIVIENAEIDGAQIQVGDEIGVFDGDVCVGAGLFDGSFNFVITAWQAGQGLPGFTPGNTMRFVIYDNSANMESNNCDAIYSIGDGTFGNGQFSSLSLNSTIYKTQKVTVTANQFNLVSFNRLPRNTNSSEVFGQIEELSIVMNDEGQSIIPAYGINTIGDIDFRDGYQLFSTTADTLYFEGTSVNPMEWDILLEANRWNSIAFLGEEPLDVTTAFVDSIVGSISIVQTSDGGVYIPSLAVNTIGQMKPGVGYQVALNSVNDIVFNYQVTNGFKAAGDVVASNRTESKFFNYTKTGLPYAVIIENPVFNNMPLNIGDEIAVFDGDLCVGATQYTGDDKVVITTWGEDVQTSLQGFTAGHEISVKFYIAAGNKIYETEVTSLNEVEKLQFKEGNYSYLTAKSTPETTGITPVNTLSEFSCYPNPSAGELNFSFWLEESVDVSIAIYNSTGQLVIKINDKNRVPGRYTSTWNANELSEKELEEGLYHYIIKAGDLHKAGKIVIINNNN